MNEPERERYETTVHDKRTGQPVAGCDGDAIARAEAAESELTALREGLEQIAAQECFYAPGSCSPPVRCPTCIARQALSGDEAKPDRCETCTGKGVIVRMPSRIGKPIIIYPCPDCTPKGEGDD